MIETYFPVNDDWLDGPLPVPPDNRPPSGWAGIERIMPALVQRFCDYQDLALEFGCEYTHSTNVLAQLFHRVTAVDWFKGDIHSGEREDYYDIAAANVAHRKNVTLVRSSYQDWLAQVSEDARYDLIHVDVVHTYEATYDIGKWATDHASVIIFHDVVAWPEVAPAVEQIAKETGKKFYVYKPCNGLGILV